MDLDGNNTFGFGLFIQFQTVGGLHRLLVSPQFQSNYQCVLFAARNFLLTLPLTNDRQDIFARGLQLQKGLALNSNRPCIHLKNLELDFFKTN